jgi:hypothetical protein
LEKRLADSAEFLLPRASFSMGERLASRAIPSLAANNVVLVHGAFADGFSWTSLIPLLEATRFNVVAVQNPLTSLAEDVATTPRLLASSYASLVSRPVEAAG